MSLFLTPREVAERWACSPRHVRRLCQTGGLRAMRLGLDAWRISVADVEAYEMAQTSGEQPAPETPRQQQVTATAVGDGLSLPAGYEPVFPALWGIEAPTKKAASVRS